MEKSQGYSFGEESIEMLEPFVEMTLERTLKRVVPNIFYRTKFSLIQSIPRRTEKVIAQQLPKIVDRIVTREIEKFQYPRSRKIFSVHVKLIIRHAQVERYVGKMLPEVPEPTGA